MRTSDLLLRQVRHAFSATFLLGGIAAVLQLALPICALHVLDSAVPARSLETLGLLASFAICAVIALAIVEAARTRILVRAGLWLGHTLGGHTIEEGLACDTSGEEIESDASALARLSSAATDGTLRALTEAPWAIVSGIALLLIDWRLGAVATGTMLALLLVGALAHGRLSAAQERVASAALRAASWLQTIVRMSGLGRMPRSATEQWERLDREHVAAAYPVHLKTAAIADLARGLRLLAQIAVLSLGAWLLIDGQIGTGTLLAAMMLTWRMLEPLECALSMLPRIIGLRHAWKRLSERPRMSIGRPLAPVDAASLPRLHFGGPVLAACMAAVVFFAAAVGTAAATRIGNLAAATGAALFDAKLSQVFPSRNGVGAHVLVSEGASVQKGDVLVTLETKRLDAHIASLKLQASTAQIELTSLHREIAQLAGPGAPPLKSRAPIEKLEARIASLDAQSKRIKTDIETAEHELSESRILAPVTGRVLSVTAKPGMPVERDLPLATLVTSDETILARLLAPLGFASLSDKFGTLARILGIAPAQAQEPLKG